MGTYQAEYYIKNRSKIREQQRIRQQETRVERAAHRRKMYAENIQFRLGIRIRNRLNDALKTLGIKKHTSAASMLGCGMDKLKEHLESKFQPGMTWSNHGEWHIDHIRPLASFDLTDPDQMAQASNYTNLQPLWATDNLKKQKRP